MIWLGSPRLIEDRYVFLVERIHIARAPYVRRSRDWLYIGCMVFMIAAFSGIVINAWVHPYHEMDPNDGRCRMGIRRKVTIPFVVVDIIMDIVLTSVFVYLLYPVVKDSWFSRISSSLNTEKPGALPISRVTIQHGRETAVQRSIKKLLQRSIFGALAITVPTVALFMVQYFVVKGEGVALVCSTICIVDGKPNVSVSTTCNQKNRLLTNYSSMGIHGHSLSNIMLFGG